MSAPAACIAANLQRVRQRIAAAADAAGRSADDVTLLAVTKYVGLPEVRALVAGGCHELGESRPQALWEKAAESLGPVRWHLIGHLQRNKVRRTLPDVAMIHSVDSERLLGAIDEAAADLDRPVRVLLEVNTSGDEAKHGWSPDQLRLFFPTLVRFTRIEIRGLMTMASRAGGTDVARANFAALRELRDELRDACPDGCVLDELSMGMSGDLEAAIAEGATIVRVGSALFEGLRR